MNHELKCTFQRVDGSVQCRWTIYAPRGRLLAFAVWRSLEMHFGMTPPTLVACLACLVCGSAARLLIARNEPQPAEPNPKPKYHERTPDPLPLGVDAIPTSSSVLTVITPSPGAVPVAVTQQSQIVTSFVPQAKWCVAPPIRLLPIATLGPPYPNSTVYSTLIPGTGSCETSYSPTSITVCATTLTGLASTVPITRCDQHVTFSSEYGFSLATPSTNASVTAATPSINTLITFYMAPWQSLGAGTSPSDVDTKVCKVLPSGVLECTYYQEVWQVNIVTATMTTTRVVDLTTTVSGPGTLMVETLHMNVTAAVTSISLSTSMALETDTEIETTSKSTRTDSVAAPGPTVFLTRQLKHASTK